MTGDGKQIQATPIPSQFDKEKMILAWVEQNQAPDKTLKVTGAGGRTGLLCSFPNYAKYVGGPAESAESYVSTAP